MTLQQDQQIIQQTEASLTALGTLSSSNFDQALQLLVQRHNAQQDILKYQNEQFRPDASNLIGQVQNAQANTDKISVISQFLRTFAEYIATQTQALEPTHSTVKSIVDAIVPMTGTNG